MKVAPSNSWRRAVPRLSRTLEPEVMESNEEARDYDTMDHGEVNIAFVTDLLVVLAECSRWSESVATALPFEILDAGTGTGLIPLELAGRNDPVHITAVDMSPAMLAIAARHAEQAGLTDRIDWQVGDCKKLALSDDWFDCVISNSLLHHLPRPESALNEFLRVLKPGGVLFLRDLTRPPSEAAVADLITTYAGGASPRQQQLFHDSLHAALTLSEVREMLKSLDLPGTAAEMTSERHWTMSLQLPTSS